MRLTSKFNSELVPWAMAEKQTTSVRRKQEGPQIISARAVGKAVASNRIVVAGRARCSKPFESQSFARATVSSMLSADQLGQAAGGTGRPCNKESGSTLSHVKLIAKEGRGVKSTRAREL